MTIVGFGFTKILVEKRKQVPQHLEIANNVSIKSVKDAPVSISNLKESKQSGLKFSFEFTSKYMPDVADILLEGDVFYMSDKDKNDKVLSDWKKEKKIPKEIMSEVINMVLTRGNVEAILLSREIALPPPIKLPRIEEKIKGNEYIG